MPLSARATPVGLGEPGGAAILGIASQWESVLGTSVNIHIAPNGFWCLQEFVDDALATNLNMVRHPRKVLMEHYMSKSAARITALSCPSAVPDSNAWCGD